MQLESIIPKLAKTVDVKDKMKDLRADLWEELERKQDVKSTETRFDELRTRLED